MKENEICQKTANHLLQIKAIKLEPANPFTWASGWLSPIYCDNRRILSFPETRDFIRDSFVFLIKDKYPEVEAIAGVATGGIAHGVLAAQELGLPFVYVRPEPKKHGLANAIEGVFSKGQKIAVIEDLISTGGSSLKAVNLLREAGAEISGLVAIFTYGFDIAKKRFAQNRCDYTTLSNYDVLIGESLKQNYIQEKDTETLKKWRKDPAKWHP